MAKEYAEDFYKSTAWLACRMAYIKSVDGLCEDCLKAGIYKLGKIVHHVKHITPDNINDPAITLSFGNLRLLCQDCHNKTHHKNNEYRYSFDENGRIIYRNMPPCS